jgi:hypothetical protein
MSATDSRSEALSEGTDSASARSDMNGRAEFRIAAKVNDMQITA